MFHYLFYQYLTELRRINLGYNLLDSVPMFSITVQKKLQTLVIRNNNLDNLSGMCPPFALPYCISIQNSFPIVNIQHFNPFCSPNTSQKVNMQSSIPIYYRPKHLPILRNSVFPVNNIFVYYHIIIYHFECQFLAYHM